MNNNLKILIKFRLVKRCEHFSKLLAITEMIPCPSDFLLYSSSSSKPSSPSENAPTDHAAREEKVLDLTYVCQ